MKTAKLAIKKFEFFVGYVAYRLGWANHNSHFEECFSKPEDLDWLENELKENGHKLQSRQQIRTVSYLKKHGRQVTV